MIPRSTMPYPDSAAFTSAGERRVTVPLGALEVAGALIWPEHPSGLVLVSQARGGRPGTLETALARELRRAGLATLQLDLSESATAARATRAADRTEVEPGVLASRLLAATRWVTEQPEVTGLVPGYLATGGAAAAALLASAMPNAAARAVVCVAGRPDLAGETLAAVRTPALLLAGSGDSDALEQNRLAFRRLECVKRLIVIEGTSHRFEEPGAVEEAGRWAAGWLVEHLAMAPRWQERRRYRASSWSSAARF